MDAIHFLEDLGIKTEVPAFMVRGEMLTEDANTSRLETKVCLYRFIHNVTY